MGNWGKEHWSNFWRGLLKLLYSGDICQNGNDLCTIIDETRLDLDVALWILLLKYLITRLNYATSIMIFWLLRVEFIQIVPEIIFHFLYLRRIQIGAWRPHLVARDRLHCRLIFSDWTTVAHRTTAIIFRGPSHRIMLLFFLTSI